MLQFTQINQNYQLHAAAEQGNMQAMVQLLQAGTDPNQLDGSNRTPLHCAARYHKADAVILLLNSGANPNAIDFNKRTPLHYAVCNKRKEHPRNMSSTPEDINTIQSLLQNDADPNTLDKDSRTPLQLALQYGNFDLIQLLAGSPANQAPNIPDTNSTSSNPKKMRKGNF